MPAAKHEAISDDIRERASLYQLGLLEQAEAGVFEHHLADCDICRREVREVGDVVKELAFAQPESRPNPRLRDELMRRTAPASVLIRAGEGALAGFRIRRRRRQAVVRGSIDWQRNFAGSHAAGRQVSAAPSRRQRALLCAPGDLVFVDHTLRAGDYEVTAPTTDHAVVTTSLGCLLLITNNVSDQVFAL